MGWQTQIEAHVDVKTTDGYVVRMFVIGFTKKRPDQVKSNCYAQTSQIRKIRKKMMEIMTKEASTVQLREFVKKLIPDSIKKVKIVKKPKFDITKFMELHGDAEGDAGVEMLRPEAEEAQNLLTAAAEADE